MTYLSRRREAQQQKGRLCGVSVVMRAQTYNGVQCLGFKTMNDYIKQHEDGISQTDPAAAITNGLQRFTGELALKLVKQSHYDVMSWLYTG